MASIGESVVWLCEWPSVKDSNTYGESIFCLPHMCFCPVKCGCFEQSCSVSHMLGVVYEERRGRRGREWFDYWDRSAAWKWSEMKCGVVQAHICIWICIHTYAHM